jgi:hypothetical protein
MSIDFSALNQVTLDCGRWSEFFPTFLAAFSGRFALGIASAEARAVLAIAPTPAAAAKLSVGRIAAALRRAGRSRGIDQAAARLELRCGNPNCACHLSWSP